jgi:methionyl-tRNA synthetase
MHDIGPYHDAIAEFRFDKALDYIWTLVKGQNQYIENEKPWKIAGEGDLSHLQEVLAYVVSTILQIADMIGPFMPVTSSEIVKMFGEEVVVESKQTLFPKINKYTKT